MTASLSCGEAIVESLVSHGVEVVFGIPGTHNLPIYDHLASHGLRHVTPRHEQGAGYAADGYARVTGKPGVCLVTTGPGVTNIATAAANAYHDSIPLLVISPGMPTDVEGRDTGYLHEVKAQSRAMDNLVHWSRRACSADEVPEALYDAFRHFVIERPRPVHIEIPLDVLTNGKTKEPIPVYRRTAPAPADPGRLRAAIQLLATARRPGLILGGGAVGATAEATQLAECVDAVVVTTCNGKGTISEEHPLTLGCALRFAAAQEELARCDVVIAVGTEVGESDLWAPRLNLRGKVLRVDIDPAQLDKNLPSSAPVLGDAAEVMRELLAALRSGDASDMREGRSAVSEVPGREWAAEIRRRIRDEVRSETAPYVRLHEILAQTLGPDSIIAGDSSRVSYFGTAYLFTVDRPRRFLYPAGFSTLGYGIPAAIGAKIAHPTRPVAALVGDGAGMFSIAEIAMASELRLGLPIIIVNNGGYAQIRNSMRARGSPLIGVDLETPDFAALGRAFGGEGVTLRSVEDLGGVLRAACGRNRPTVIELRMDD
ncbi:MAG TPA: 5-guanidino-2-oxopentanoate decarboxylase [Chloroflexota bacterium]